MVMPQALGRLGRCDHCDEPLSKEELDLEVVHGALRCPTCERTGCGECMPAGRGCMCPECEEAQGDVT